MDHKARQNVNSCSYTATLPRKDVGSCGPGATTNVGADSLPPSDASVRKDVNVTVARRPNAYPYVALFFILMSTTLQSAASGVQAVLEIYFVDFLFVCSSDANSLSTMCVNIFIACWLVAALPAGILADYCLGNYGTQFVSMMGATVALWLVTLSSWQFAVTKPQCCANVTILPTSNCSELTKTILPNTPLGWSPQIFVAISLSGLVLFALSFGQTNSIGSVFVGDQFEEEKSAAKERSFSWFYLCMNVGQLIAEGGFPVARQSAGFIVTLLIATGLYTMNFAIFISGTWSYRKKNPSCNNYSCKNRDSETVHLLADRKPQCTDKKTFWQLMRIVGVFSPLIVYWAVFFQQNSTWVLQGRQLNCYLGTLHIPPDMMPSVNDVMVIILIPVMDYIVYPHIRKSIGLSVKPLHKIIAGMTAASLSFLLALLLQLYVKVPLSPCQGQVSLLWQLPQLLLISFAEVLVSVTGLEFAYSQSPPHLRNIIVGMWYITQALGTLLNAAIALIRFPLEYEFGTYTVLMLAVNIAFVAINWRYKYRNES